MTSIMVCTALLAPIDGGYTPCVRYLLTVFDQWSHGRVGLEITYRRISGILHKSILQTARATGRRPHRAEQGSGLNGAPSGSLLKCVLWTNGSRRFSGSLTSVTIVSQVSPFGAVMR